VQISQHEYIPNIPFRADEKRRNNSSQAPASWNQQNPYQSREQIEQPRQGNYGPPPYDNQQPRQSRHIEKGESQGQHWHSGNNPDAQRATGAQGYLEDKNNNGQWRQQDQYSHPAYSERRVMEPKQQESNLLDGEKD
jgi:hypothetical protein